MSTVVKSGLALPTIERRLCKEYIVDFDIREAALRAGYSEEAIACAEAVLQKPEVIAYLEHLQEQQQWLDRINVQEVLAELSKIAFADVKEMSDELQPEPFEGPKVGKEAQEAAQDETRKPENKRDFWRRVDLDPSANPQRYTGASTCRISYKDRMTGRLVVLSFSVTAKMAALKLLGQHLGLFVKGKPAMRTPNIIFPRTDDYVPLDQRTTPSVPKI